MKKMPEYIKNKLRKLQKLNEQAKELEISLVEDFGKYKLDISNFCASGNGEKQTEAFTFVTYGEGTAEQNIEFIEEVFLYYVNKNRRDISD